MMKNYICRQGQQAGWKAIYSKRQNNLSFTTGDAHDFAKVDAAFHAAQNRRSERQKQKFLSFTIQLYEIPFKQRAG